MDPGLALWIFLMLAILPWSVYQSIKLARFGYLRGEELFQISKSKRKRSERDG